MSLLTQGVGTLFEKRSTASTGLLSSFLPWAGTATTAAGKKVNRSTSLKISAFYCALTLLADSYAILPKSVFQVKDKNRTRLTDHPLDYILHNEANTQMTAFMYSWMSIYSAFIKGNFYSGINRNNAGEMVSLDYWDADLVDVWSNKGKIYYKYMGRTYTQDEVFHVAGFCENGITGRSIIHYAADSMGTPLAAQEYGANSYNEKGITTGALETEKSLESPAKKAIRAAFNEALSDENPHRAVILDEGFKYKPIRLSPEQSKFIEAKVEGVADIARWFKIPLPYLKVKGEGGYNFMVQMSIEYLQHALLPISEKFKQEANRKLLTAREREQGMYINHNWKKLLQVDPKARTEYYRNMVVMKAMMPNEIRELEDMNPYDGGDEVLQMLNMQTPSQIEKTLENAEA